MSVAFPCCSSLFHCFSLLVVDFPTHSSIAGEELCGPRHSRQRRQLSSSQRTPWQAAAQLAAAAIWRQRARSQAGRGAAGSGGDSAAAGSQPQCSSGMAAWQAAGKQAAAAARWQWARSPASCSAEPSPGRPCSALHAPVHHR